MTEREKIIEILHKCAEPDGDFGIDNAVAFYRAVQADAFEQAAKLCEASELYPLDAHYTAYMADMGKAIRQLGKEK